jgi:UDP-N-acetylmuramoyl-L-alanyl-D-glutamate--2,6-diaminopimelate ligase
VRILQDILYKAGVIEITGTINMEIVSVEFDSRKIVAGSLFVATIGTRVDGHDYIGNAIKNGAIAIVCNQLPATLENKISYIVVNDSTVALAHIASNFYDNPSEKLKIVGITGTNGKTTIATLLTDLFTDLGYCTGMLTTIQNKVNNSIIESTHTTPDAIKINELLHMMVEEGCEYVFMEVSSHAIVQKRIEGIQFTGAVFTNITHDHLDYHGTFNEYLKAKKSFFDNLPESAFSITNSDDKNGNVILQNTHSKKHTYGLKNMSNFRGKIIENGFEGMMMRVDGNELYSLLAGNFNAYNILAIYATAILLNQNKEETLIGISKLKGAEGRFDIIKSESNITAIIDYAHTPDALENVLSTINSIRTHNEELITVVGAGGDRDTSKRPLMAKIASLLSTRVILTSDNPRSEDPNTILKEMRSGIDPAKTGSTMVIPDRKEAIIAAYNMARSGDMILVAGKGHEKYQEIKGVKHPFDDKRIIAELMNINK